MARSAESSEMRGTVRCIFVFTALDEGGLVSTSRKEEGVACDGELRGEGHNAGGRGACLFVSCSAMTLGDY